MALEHLNIAAAKDQLRRALDAFDTALPGAVDARNVLEHFDAYTRGMGDQQQSVIKRRQRAADEQLAREYRIDFEHVDHDPQRPRLRIGPHTIDLPRAGQAADLLVHEIRAALMADQGMPSTRRAP